MHTRACRRMCVHMRVCVCAGLLENKRKTVWVWEREGQELLDMCKHVFLINHIPRDQLLRQRRKQMESLQCDWCTV